MKRHFFDLKKHYSVAVIGGGPVGCSVALHLCRAGATNVTVIERDNSYKTASCMLSAGGIRQQFSLFENVKMSTYGAEFLKNASKEAKESNDVPDIQFHENGYLFLANREETIRENNRIQRESGADWINLYSSDELKKSFSWLNNEGLSIGSFSSRNEGYFDPWAFVAYMKQKAIGLGATFVEGEVFAAEVNCRDFSGPSLSSNSSSGLNSGAFQSQPIVKQVVTQNQRTGVQKVIQADFFVNAAGAWSNQLLQLILHSVSKLTVASIPIRPRKRLIFTIHCPERHGAAHVPPSNTPLVIDPTGVYFRPEGSGQRFITGVSPNKSQDRDYAGTAEELSVTEIDDSLFDDVIWPTLALRVPAFECVKVVNRWAGFYDYNTFDQNAIIGLHPEIPNLMICAGFSGHGLQHSPAAGRAVAELLMEGRFTSLDLKRFAFDRVLENKPLYEMEIV